MWKLKYNTSDIMQAVQYLINHKIPVWCDPMILYSKGLFSGEDCLKAITERSRGLKVVTFYVYDYFLNSEGNLIIQTYIQFTKTGIRAAMNMIYPITDLVLQTVQKYEKD